MGKASKRSIIFSQEAELDFYADRSLSIFFWKSPNVHFMAPYLKEIFGNFRFYQQVTILAWLSFFLINLNLPSDTCTGLPSICPTISTARDCVQRMKYAKGTYRYTVQYFAYTVKPVMATTRIWRPLFLVTDAFTFKTHRIRRPLAQRDRRPPTRSTWPATTHPRPLCTVLVM